MNRTSPRVTSSAKSFNPKKSIQRAKVAQGKKGFWAIKIGKKTHQWSSNMERIEIARKGIRFVSIEVISKRANLPIKQILRLFEIPQTTYNKKKKKNEILELRDGELILVLSEVLAYGLLVFNDEEDKFHRWLKKPNISLGGIAPETLFDSLTGIEEVRSLLNRLEYGNMA